MESLTLKSIGCCVCAGILLKLTHLELPRYPTAVCATGVSGTPTEQTFFFFASRAAPSGIDKGSI